MSVTIPPYGVSALSCCLIAEFCRPMQLSPAHDSRVRLEDDDDLAVAVAHASDDSRTGLSTRHRRHALCDSTGSIARLVRPDAHSSSAAVDAASTAPLVPPGAPAAPSPEEAGDTVASAPSWLLRPDGGVPARSREADARRSVVRRLGEKGASRRPPRSAPARVLPLAPRRHTGPNQSGSGSVPRRRSYRLASVDRASHRRQRRDARCARRSAAELPRREAVRSGPSF